MHTQIYTYAHIVHTYAYTCTCIHTKFLVSGIGGPTTSMSHTMPDSSKMASRTSFFSNVTCVGNTFTGARHYKQVHTLNNT